MMGCSVCDVCIWGGGGAGCLQGEIIGIRVIDGLLNGLDTHYGDDGPERLLERQSHVLGHVVNQQRPDQVALRA